MHSHGQPYQDVGEDFYDSKIEDIEIKKFAADMIEVAVRDAMQFRNITLHEDALRWIDSRETSVCGYGWALVYSGVNPNLVRQAITAAEKEHQQRLARENRKEAVLAIVGAK